MQAFVIVVVAALLASAAPFAGARPIEVGEVVVDLRWMTACPGPWGHEEREHVGPVVIVTYECDDGGT